MKHEETQLAQLACHAVLCRERIMESGAPEAEAYQPRQLQHWTCIA